MYNRRTDGYALSKQRREKEYAEETARRYFIYPVDDKHRTAVAAGRNCLRDYRRILTAAPGEVSVRFAIVDQIEEWFGEKDENSTG